FVANNLAQLFVLLHCTLQSTFSFQIFTDLQSRGSTSPTLVKRWIANRSACWKRLLKLTNILTSLPLMEATTANGIHA
ncbi:hypothetical protein O181_017339, partial [Austropuccinia psidii MF-1]|nr:hypothetical protein [Austropuccinia psidii MF-1]